MSKQRAVSPLGCAAWGIGVALGLVGLVNLFIAPLRGLAFIGVALLVYFGGMTYDYLRYRASTQALEPEGTDVPELGGHGIVVRPTAEQFAHARVWGRAQSQNIVVRLMSAGYGKADDESNMALVYTSLSWTAFAASQFGSEAWALEHPRSFVECLAVEWTVWVPALDREVAQCYQAYLVQGSTAVPSASLDIAFPPGAEAGHEVAAQITAHFRYSDFALNAPTELVLKRPGDPRGDLAFSVDLGKIA